MNNLRVDFERAMQKYSQVNEGNQREYMGLAQSSRKEDKDTLYNMINADLFKNKAPFERIKLDSFSAANMAKVDSILSKDKNGCNNINQLRS